MTAVRQHPGGLLRPRLPHAHARVSYVELFFDLAFVLAVAQPLCGAVFVLDGVLIGAGDGRYLAIAGGINLVPYLPCLVLIAVLHPTGAAGLAWLAVAFFGVYMLARLGTLGWRIRSSRWMGFAV